MLQVVPPSAVLYTPSLPSAYWLSSADTKRTFGSAGEAAMSAMCGAYSAPGISPCTANVGCGDVSCRHVCPESSERHTPQNCLHTGESGRQTARAYSFSPSWNGCCSPAHAETNL